MAMSGSTLQSAYNTVSSPAALRASSGTVVKPPPCTRWSVTTRTRLPPSRRASAPVRPLAPQPKITWVGEKNSRISLTLIAAAFPSGRYNVLGHVDRVVEETKFFELIGRVLDDGPWWQSISGVVVERRFSQHVDRDLEILCGRDMPVLDVVAKVLEALEIGLVPGRHHIWVFRNVFRIHGNDRGRIADLRIVALRHRFLQRRQVADVGRRG